MKNNLLMYRLFLLLFTTILLGSVIAGVIYTQRAKSMFAELKADELQESAEILADEYYTYKISGGFTEEYFYRWLRYAADSSKARVAIYDAETGTRIEEEFPKDNIMPRDGSEKEDVDLLLDNTYRQIASNNTTVAEIMKLPNTKDANYLVVGVPHVLDTGELACVVFFTKPVDNVTSGLSGLNKTLFFIYLLVFALIMIPVYLASRQMMKPLNAMRDVAMSMAKGDFNLRADEDEPGEVGQLSRTLNYLAGELSQTIAALTLERNRLRMVIDGLAEGIVAMDAYMNITHINPPVCELFDFEMPSDGDLKNVDIIPPELMGEFRRVLDNKVTVVRSFRWKNMILRVIISPLNDEAGTVSGAVALFHDVTESERLEQTRREFVANVSHELRTPLSALRGLAEVLVDDMLKTEEEKQRYYGLILHESMRLGRLIDDLLELSRLQTGSVSTQKMDFDAAELAYEIHEKYSFTAEYNEIDFKLDFNPDACPDAYGNMDRTEQVCVILLDNAFKFTPRGGSITLNLMWDTDKLYFTVTDTGCGISAEDKEQVFDRFYKVDKAHTGGGTGLGLSIAREIMTLLGERIWISATSESGTSFTFTVSRADSLDAIRQKRQNSLMPPNEEQESDE